jgi:AAA15 family ATPase/GTPase
MPIDEHNDLVDVFMALEFQESCDSKPLLLSSMEAQRNFQTPKAKMDVEFVSTGRNSKRIAELWDNINLTDLKEEVVAALKIIEPSIRDVGLTIGNDNKRFVIVRLNGSSARLSLESLGEGMSRLFHLTLALVNSSNGFLLIDEFENGLHYTVLPLVWKLIFRLAKDLNVQVFATTHSHDCVTAFQAASQNETTLFRLGRSRRKSDKGKIIAIEYDKEELQLVAESEVRG